MHNGTDSAYYLSLGHRVVAIEANPSFVERGRRRFAREIETGQLTIVAAGIAEHPGRLTFWVNEQNDEWSSFSEDFGRRGGTPSHAIEVETVRFRDVVEQYGVPHYLKIDIEGNDRCCLKDLLGMERANLPKYISVEAHSLDYLCMLFSLGYSKFKVVNQGLLWKVQNVPGYEFQPTSSGPFGDDAPGAWQTLEVAAYDWLHTQVGRPELSNLGPGWYDFHAAMADGPEDQPTVWSCQPAVDRLKELLRLQEDAAGLRSALAVREAELLRLQSANQALEGSLSVRTSRLMDRWPRAKATIVRVGDWIYRQL
jgi:FkbM family methyltransferase